MRPTLSQSQAPLLAALLAILAATAGAALWPTPPAADDVPGLLSLRALIHWDSGWYGAIARDGYTYHPGQQSSVAFFPLYPLSISALAALGVNR